MRSLTVTPRQALRPYVQLFWCLEVDGAEDFGPAERIAPDGIVELVVHYRGGTTTRFAEDAFSPMPASAFVCQATRYLDVCASGAAGFVSVRFLPWGALHFFDMPVDELADRVVPTEAAWGRDAEQLPERLAEAAGSRERVAMVESFLLGRLARFRKADVEAALRAVWREGGRASIPELCRDLGVTQRTAQRLFRRSVGMPPKRYARLVRFLTVCGMIRRADQLSLGEIGLRCGYYDQAHLNADFRWYAGMSPSEFVASPSVSFLEIA